MHGSVQAGRRPTTLAVGAALLAVCAFAGCYGPTDAVADRTTSEPLRRGTFRQVVLLTGELDAVTAHPVLVPRLPGWRVPIRWLVEDGARVAEGDRVAELDSTQILADLDNRRIALDGAANELAGKQAEIAAGEADKRRAHERARFERERAALAAAVPAEILPLREWQENQLALERADNDLAKAEADLEAFLEAAEADMEVLRIALDGARRDLRVAERAARDMVLRAPRDGLVVVGENRRENRKFQIGDDAWVGLELLTLPELDRMRVHARLFDVDDGRVVPGQRATCTLDTYPDRAFGCEVRSIRPVAKEFGYRSSRRAFDVEVLLDASDPSIMRPGMSVRVEVETASSGDVWLVRRDALVFEDDGAVRLAGRPGAEPLRLGPCSALDCVVLDGAGVAGASR